MPQVGELFVSHSSKDKAITNHFGELLRSLSLHQIGIWFSSDASSNGGLRPGDQWFEKIREKMASSSAVVALVTQNSISNNWVYFESGFGAAIPNKKLMLVTHNITSLSEIPPPLSAWQAFRIDMSEGLSEFCAKLFEIYDIRFDDVLFENYSRKYFSAIQAIKTPSENADARGKNPAGFDRHSDSQHSDLLKHFDRRFFELASQLKVQSPYVSYEIKITNNFSGETFAIEISDALTLQDVMDEIWYSIQEHVASYTYLRDWILVHRKTSIKLVAREILHAIPASSIFHPGSEWIVVPLEKPYSPLDSKPESQPLKLTD